MQTFYLAFPSKGSAQRALEGAGWIDEEGVVAPPSGHLWDPIGGFIKSPPIFGPDGEPLSPALKDARFHVNIYVTEGEARIPANMVQYIVHPPKTPRRVLG